MPFPNEEFTSKTDRREVVLNYSTCNLDQNQYRGAILFNEEVTYRMQLHDNNPQC